jgi:LPPG:FO 2-phospho-L-lactate transferase
MSAQPATGPRVVALCGGVGGSKLALGLQLALAPGELAIIANTGDDMEHLGLRICPDIDTLTYTLAGLANPAVGWGRRDETWAFMDEIARFGGPTWFGLGDRDLALHVERSWRLRAGESLSAVTARITRAFAIAAQIIPASDQDLRTVIVTDEGGLGFQDYFVRRRCEPAARGFRYDGAETARPAPAALAALASPALEAIVLCPSNPYLSLAPILAVPGLVPAIRAAGVPVVVVSPLVGGKAVKGPTAKIIGELGLACDNRTIAAFYRGLADVLVVDRGDAAPAAEPGVAVVEADTLMRDEADRIRLARAVLAAAAEAAPRAGAAP